MSPSPYYMSPNFNFSVPIFPLLETTPIMSPILPLPLPLPLPFPDQFNMLPPSVFSLTQHNVDFDEVENDDEDTIIDIHSIDDIDDATWNQENYIDFTPDYTDNELCNSSTNTDLSEIIEFH